MTGEGANGFEDDLLTSACGTMFVEQDMICGSQNIGNRTFFKQRVADVAAYGTYFSMYTYNGFLGSVIADKHR